MVGNYPPLPSGRPKPNVRAAAHSAFLKHLRLADERRAFGMLVFLKDTSGHLGLPKRPDPPGKRPANDLEIIGGASDAGSDPWSHARGQPWRA